MEKREEERRLKVEREREEKELRESWAELKLDPQMRVISQPHKYVITGNIPGMDQKDIGIEVVDQGAALQISGVRLPSSEEMVCILYFVFFFVFCFCFLFLFFVLFFFLIFFPLLTFPPSETNEKTSWCLRIPQRTRERVVIEIGSWSLWAFLRKIFSQQL